MTGIGHSGARCTDEGGRGGIRGGGAVRGMNDNRWQFAIRNQTPKNEIAKLEYLFSVQQKAMSDAEGSRRPDEQPARDRFVRQPVVRTPSTHWAVGVPRGRCLHEPQHYAQQQHRMQPYPMNQQGGYADAMPGHGQVPPLGIRVPGSVQVVGC